MRLGPANAWLRARLPARLGGRLRTGDLRFSVLGPDDLTACLALYGAEGDREQVAGALAHPGGYQLGAWLGRRLVGTAGCFSQFGDHGVPDLFCCGVHVPRRQRSRGIGRALVQACVAEARRRGETDLWAQISLTNDASRRMFEASGFIEFQRPDWGLMIPGAQEWVFVHCDLTAQT